MLDDHSLYKSVKSSLLETLLFISLSPSIDFYWVTNCKKFYTKICKINILDPTKCFRSFIPNDYNVFKRKRFSDAANFNKLSELGFFFKWFVIIKNVITMTFKVRTLNSLQRFHFKRKFDYFYYLHVSMC